MRTPQLSNLFLGLIATAVLFAFSCKKDDEENIPGGVNPPPVHTTTPYELNIPDYFPRFIVPDFNPTTVEGVALGKRIYYDKMLSLGGPLQGKSCGSCHQQENSFSSPKTGTQVLAHVNLNYTNYFLWNGGKEGSLEDVCLFEISEFFQADISLFQQDSTYKRMMYNAFGVVNFDENEMAFALAQWFRSLNSFNSKFDLFWEDKIDLNPLEEMGYLIFNSEKGDCFHCHSFPLMADHNFHNIGLDSIFNGENLGRFAVTNDESDLGRFKSPTLRNIALTAPYMHDGRFQTLEEVIEHYNSGVKNSPSLDAIMTKPGKENGLNLSDVDKAALLAFLKTLTDTSFINNPEHANPF
ncbi:MAG: cytochrome c peroxidase [Vicingaceae bacterium]